MADSRTLVRNDLVPHGFDVFVDIAEHRQRRVRAGDPARDRGAAHFLVLLEPRSLDRISEPGDWLRRETAHALTPRRNVVPLLANGARMPAPPDLPADLARLPSFNAVSVPHDYFAEAMQKLRDRFLRPLDPVPAARRRWHGDEPADRPCAGPAARRRSRPPGPQGRSQGPAPAGRRRLLVRRGRGHQL